jgi:hypothetical protein
MTMKRYKIAARTGLMALVLAALGIANFTAPALGQPGHKDEECSTCPRSAGFWLNHPEEWPVDELELGGVVYSKEEALVFLHDPPNDDPGFRMMRQLVAAELNVAMGVNPALVYLELEEAHQLLSDFPPGAIVTQDIADRCAEIADILDEFNLGLRSALAVEYVSFEARIDQGQVAISWATASEENNAGFEIQHASTEGRDFASLAFVAGNGTTDKTNYYAYRIDGLGAGTHTFRLKQVDFDGAYSYSAAIEVAVELSDSFVLGSAYPNPFNPATTIRFGLREAGQINLSVYDIVGRHVATLANGPMEAGSHEVTFQADNLPSGTYVYRLSTSVGTSNGTVVLLK